jgi:hypothetical protein
LALEQLREAERKITSQNNDKNSQGTQEEDEINKMLAEDVKGGKLRGSNTTMLPVKKM